MHRVLMIESGVHGALMVNGCFCGPLEGEGQAFPAGENAEIYVQFFPFSSEIRPLSAVMKLSKGKIVRLEPQEQCYALVWPDGIIQLELRPVREGAAEEATGDTQSGVSGTLMRYLSLRLAGDAQARQLLMQPQETPELPGYDAVVPLRFAPLQASERFDDRAGLLRRQAANVAVIDAALAMTSPAGQGHRLIERIVVMPT